MTVNVREDATCLVVFCAAHSVRFEEAQAAGESTTSVAEAAHETLVQEWKRSTSGLLLEERTESPLDAVNMPIKRNLDAWCFAEHMDMPVLLQVVCVLFYYISAARLGSKRHRVFESSICASVIR